MSEQYPVFLKLFSSDLRWHLVQALSESDRKVQELVELLGKPQNLVSYHLKRLGESQVVHERRSSNDAREVYYSLDLDRMARLYAETGQVVHPALAAQACSDVRPADLPPARVLFLCTHNSIRSQMAEGLLRARSWGRVQAFSAGTEPAEVHPLAVQALGEMGIDISRHESKPVSAFAGQDFDAVITVCDRARENCPVFPGAPKMIHWSFADPAEVEGAPEARLVAFRETARQINTRIGYYLLFLERKETA